MACRDWAAKVGGGVLGRVWALVAALALLLGLICDGTRPRPGRVLQGRALRAVVHRVGRPGLRPGPHVGLHRPGHRQAHGLLRPRRAPHARPGRHGAVAHGGRPLLGPRLLPRRGARLLVRRARGLVR